MVTVRELHQKATLVHRLQQRSSRRPAPRQRPLQRANGHTHGSALSPWPQRGRQQRLGCVVPPAAYLTVKALAHSCAPLAGGNSATLEPAAPVLFAMDVQGPAGFSGRAHGAASSSGATGGGSGANAHTANTASGTFYDARMHAGPSHPSNHDPRAPHTSPPPSPRTSPLRGAMSPPVLPSASSYDSWFSPRAGRTVAYSDRFIPSRAQSARVDYSLLDREMATSEVRTYSFVFCNALMQLRFVYSNAL